MAGSFTMATGNANELNRKSTKRPNDFGVHRNELINANVKNPNCNN